MNILFKLRQLTRLITANPNTLVHVWDPTTGKDHYILVADLLSGFGYPTWNSTDAAAGNYDTGSRVTHGLKLWESLVDDNAATPTEGANWTEVSAETRAYVDCGDYDASGNAFPTTGGTGTSGAIKRGNTFDISVAGTLGGEEVPPGATIRAKVDTPGQTLSNWRISY